jgi:hypothetical protein
MARGVQQCVWLQRGGRRYALIPPRMAFGKPGRINFGAAALPACRAPVGPCAHRHPHLQRPCTPPMNARAHGSHTHAQALPRLAQLAPSLKRTQAPTRTRTPKPSQYSHSDSPSRLKRVSSSVYIYVYICICIHIYISIYIYKRALATFPSRFPATVYPISLHSPLRTGDTRPPAPTPPPGIQLLRCALCTCAACNATRRVTGRAARMHHAAMQPARTPRSARIPSSSALVIFVEVVSGNDERGEL